MLSVACVEKNTWNAISFFFVPISKWSNLELSDRQFVSIFCHSKYLSKKSAEAVYKWSSLHHHYYLEQQQQQNIKQAKEKTTTEFCVYVFWMSFFAQKFARPFCCWFFSFSLSVCPQYVCRRPDSHPFRLWSSLLRQQSIDLNVLETHTHIPWHFSFTHISVIYLSADKSI